jgi:hypothetical protein
MGERCTFDQTSATPSVSQPGIRVLGPALPERCATHRRLRDDQLMRAASAR